MSFIHLNPLPPLTEFEIDFFQALGVFTDFFDFFLCKNKNKNARQYRVYAKIMINLNRMPT